MSLSLNIKEILEKVTLEHASDLFLVAGIPVTYKVNGSLQTLGERLSPADTEQLIRQIYELAGQRSTDTILQYGDDDFSLALPGVSRFRVSTFKQRGTLAAVIRLIVFELPNPNQIGIPQSVLSMADFTKGMVLVTGAAGSGKSTTLSCLVNRINSTRANHIITLEDPLEYLHRHKMSIVSQREISSDTRSYLTALRAALRQSPDVILLGEMRDHETIQIAMTAAETGHLILSSLHTIGAASTISRIIDVFEPSQQHQIAIQLSMILRAVISQQLIPAVDGSLIPAFEIMVMNPAISNLIRDNKIHQIDGIIYTSAREDMISMDNSLLQLYKNHKITRETALQYSTNPEMLKKKLL